MWRRACDIYGPETNIFVGKIEPDDIKQGELGDCYFLSALSSLAEFPINIQRLFETVKYDQNTGYFIVSLCIDGEFRQIVVDDLFPCSQTTQQPLFSKGNGKELWVLILEKAYAKSYGGYYKIEAGLTGEAIRDLSGAPYFYYSTKEGHETIWNVIKNADKKGEIVTAGSKRSLDGRFEQDLGKGIVSSHAYAILEVAEVGTERIIKMRNPWGQGEWKGDWSDGSTKWTEALKK